MRKGGNIMIINDKIIIADDGMMLTNGEVYAKTIRLGDWDTAENYHEITYAEYEGILQAQMEEMNIMF